MLLQCVSNASERLPGHYQAAFVTRTNPHYEWPLVPGKAYLACAVSFFSGFVLYLVRTERNGSPEFMPAPFFKVVDSRIPQYWGFWAVSEFYENNLQCVLGYPELTDGSGHYDALVDGKPEAVRLFNQRFQEMDDELTSR
jgi:hypothetical protein